MNDLSKYILNHLLQNGVLKYNEAPELINKIAEKLKLQRKNIKQIITEINENISKQQFRVDVRTCEITSDKICVFINTSIDDLSATTSNLSPVELELLEVIFREIMLSNSKSISSILSLNLTNRLRGNISKDDAQLKLDSWFQNGYLIQNDGIVFLGPRAISEFESYFKVQFSERMILCKLCKDYVYFGKICASCNEVLHKHCIVKHLNRTNCCPICKNNWIEAQERNYDVDDSDNETMNSE